MKTSSTPHHETESRAILVTLAVSAFLVAAGLLGLQIIGGHEYTAGGSLYTQASMIAVMVTIAVLPVFLEAALRYRHRAISAGLVIAFLAFLFYSLPATTGRTGELKEGKATAAVDLQADKAKLESVQASLDEVLPVKIAECAGAPDPLPASGWPKCRTAMGQVSMLEARKAELAAAIAAGSDDALGDLGSELWAWALSWLGFTAPTIRKISVLAFAIGLDFVIWSLVAFGSAMLQRAVRTQSAAIGRPVPSDTAQTSFPDGWHSPDGPGRRDGPKRPRPDSPGGSKADAERYVVTEVALGRTIPSQQAIAGRFDRPKSTVSDWFKDWEKRGVIPARTQAGRCKAVVGA